jgi:hypothetical protein
MRPPLVNTWGIVAPRGIHVITATLTTLLVGIVTIVVIAATVTRIATIMAETAIGVIAEVLLLLVAVDTLLIIGVAGATPVAHPLEEVVLHLVAERVEVAQETTIHQPPQQALLQLQLLLGNTRGGKEFHAIRSG